MSKAVLISIRPKWCSLIASGKKTIEVRKTRPKLEPPFKVYIYQTLPKWGDWNGRDGHVIGEFVCDWIKDFGFSPYNHGEYIGIERLHEESCVGFDEMYQYIGESFGFGWHISDLKIYDKPKKLNEFCLYSFGVKNGWYRKPLERAPQSYCFVEELE